MLLSRRTSGGTHSIFAVRMVDMKDNYVLARYDSDWWNGQVFTITHVAKRNLTVRVKIMATKKRKFRANFIIQEQDKEVCGELVLNCLVGFTEEWARRVMEMLITDFSYNNCCLLADGAKKSKFYARDEGIDTKYADLEVEDIDAVSRQTVGFELAQ